MKKLLATNPQSNTALIARIALGVVLFPHGAQKLLGWFGGYGFDGTMGFLTGGAGLPYIIALLVILIEFFGALFLIFGFSTRLAAIGVIGNFIGVVATSHINNGFFMNWSGQQQGEGFEYHLLALAIAVAIMIMGSGKWSIDSMLQKKTSEPKYHKVA